MSAIQRELMERSQAYARRRGIEWVSSLGSGVEGTVWQVRKQPRRATWALKMHIHAAGFERELECYQRLAENSVCDLAGFNVPNLLRFDRAARALEMTMVQRPFILDFAQTYLDEPPDFSEEVLAETRRTWIELYGPDWPKVNAALWQLQRLGIHYLDVHRGNIALL